MGKRKTQIPIPIPDGRPQLQRNEVKCCRLTFFSDERQGPREDVEEVR